MASIFAVSPDFLDSLIFESKDFDFSLQGYGTFECAIDGLLQINVKDIIGFIIMARRPPKNTGSMLDFLKKCNLMCSDSQRTVIFAFNDRINTLARLGLKDRFPNINARLLQLDVITNITIRRDLFGTLLLSVYKPYLFNNDTQVYANQFSIPVLSYEPLFSDLVYKVMEDITCFSNVNHTKFNDKHLEALQESNEILALLRELRILKKHHEDTRLFETGLISKIESITDTRQYCIYKALLKVVKECD